MYLTEDQVSQAMRIASAYFAASCAESNAPLRREGWHTARWDALASGFDSTPGLGIEAAEAFILSELLLVKWRDPRALEIYAARVRAWARDRRAGLQSLTN